MRIDVQDPVAAFRHAQRGKASVHTAASRLHPSRLRYDYLTLSLLGHDVTLLISGLEMSTEGGVALDLGSDQSPYRQICEARGFRLLTLDLTTEHGADFAGSAEATGFVANSFDLVLCTQVLEHCDDPFQSVREIKRILKPGGHALLTAPHVWFFHPHPKDHWRFTQQGMLRLCTAAGLEPVEVLAQGGTLLTMGQITNFVTYGVLGRWGAPLYCLVNLLAPLADRIVPSELFCHNFVCLARRPVAG